MRPTCRPCHSPTAQRSPGAQSSVPALWPFLCPFILKAPASFFPAPSFTPTARMSCRDPPKVDSSRPHPWAQHLLLPPFTCQSSAQAVTCIHTPEPRPEATLGKTAGPSGPFLEFARGHPPEALAPTPPHLLCSGNLTSQTLARQGNVPVSGFPTSYLAVSYL